MQWEKRVGSNHQQSTVQHDGRYQLESPQKHSGNQMVATLRRHETCTMDIGIHFQKWTAESVNNDNRYPVRISDFVNGLNNGYSLHDLQGDLKHIFNEHQDFMQMAIKEPCGEMEECIHSLPQEQAVWSRRERTSLRAQCGLEPMSSTKC